MAIVVKYPSANSGDVRDMGLIPGLGRSSRERKWQPTPVFLPGKSQGWWSLVGCHLWGRTESDKTEETEQQQHFLILIVGFSKQG